MANCNLVILFDDKKPKSNGEPITGTVVVKANKDVNCKGLVAQTEWSTHGRGNIAMGVIAEQTLFTGPWQSGQEYRYAFKLDTAAWPPSYYGTYINVGQYVSVRAKLSWATDPKASVEYPVIATSSPDDLAPQVRAAKSAGIIGSVIGGTIAVVILLLLLLPLGMLALIVLPFAAIIGGLVWFFRVFLPRQITGPVECKLTAERVAAGEVIQANLSFTPRKSTKIHGIEWKVTCIEECSSGSGSNRKTHTTKILEHDERSCGELQLEPNKQQSFDFQFEIPASAAPSMKFTDNTIKWTLLARIDIPGWPDWTKTLSFIVEPSAKPDLQRLLSSFSESYRDELDEEDWDDEDEGLEEEDQSTSLPPVVAPLTSAHPQSLSPDDAWFAQVLEQMRRQPDGGEQLTVIVDAVRDYVFPMEVLIQKRTAPPYVCDEFGIEHLEDSTWWHGVSPKHQVELALAWNESVAKPLPGKVWSGSANIVGYDYENDIVVMEVTA